MELGANPAPGPVMLAKIAPDWDVAVTVPDKPVPVYTRSPTTPERLAVTVFPFSVTVIEPVTATRAVAALAAPTTKSAAETTANEEMAARRTAGFVQRCLNVGRTKVVCLIAAPPKR